MSQYLIGKPFVGQDHGQMEDATNRSHAVGHLQHLLGLLQTRDIQSRHFDLFNLQRESSSREGKGTVNMLMLHGLAQMESCKTCA